tara:strand:- start:446 stop:1219 length:774 start_codon:yes stop_codon:yes gene_type:complete
VAKDCLALTVLTVQQANILLTGHALFVPKANIQKSPVVWNVRIAPPVPKVRQTIPVFRVPSENIPKRLVKQNALSVQVETGQVKKARQLVWRVLEHKQWMASVLTATRDSFYRTNNVQNVHVDGKAWGKAVRSVWSVHIRMVSNVKIVHQEVQIFAIVPAVGNVVLQLNVKIVLLVNIALRVSVSNVLLVKFPKPVAFVNNATLLRANMAKRPVKFAKSVKLDTRLTEQRVLNVEPANTNSNINAKLVLEGGILTRR